MLKNIFSFRNLILLFLVYAMNSCISTRTKGFSRGVNSLYETFFVGEFGTQYFIKPIEFLGVDNSDKIDLDFTFRYKDSIKDTITINFSIKSEKLFKDLDIIEIFNIDKKIKSKELKLMYNDKYNKLFISRFTSSFSLEEIYTMFSNENWTISLLKGIDKYRFKSSKKSRKAIKKLNENIFFVLK